MKRPAHSLYCKFLIFLLLISAVPHFIGKVFSTAMESPNYRLQLDTVNNQSEKTGDNNIIALDKILEKADILHFQEKGYALKYGCAYFSSGEKITPFVFTVSKSNNNFGMIQPFKAQSRETDLIVSFAKMGQYQVTAIKETLFVNFNADKIIADTICGENNKCDRNHSKPWVSDKNYGFGYNLAGNDIPFDFVNSTYFRPFANKILAESPIVVMSGNIKGNLSKTKITQKLILRTNQQAESYYAVINFTASPLY